jgi:hypothetical protein
MHSDYIVYVDESGDANLANPNPDYPMFVLAFCIFRKDEYVGQVSPSLQRLKFKHFGHDAVVLHERDIRKQLFPFVFLKSLEKRIEFMADLDRIITDAPMTVLAASIHKNELKARYKAPYDPYFYAVKLCVERLDRFLSTRSKPGQRTYIIFEKRGKDEDSKLELEFRRIKDGANYRSAKLPDLEIIFADKRANSAGLQIADLIARPVGLRHFRPQQPNRAFDIIEPKFDRDLHGHYRGFGLEAFP